jgi:hypothetical protein
MVGLQEVVWSNVEKEKNKKKEEDDESYLHDSSRSIQDHSLSICTSSVKVRNSYSWKQENNLGCNGSSS